MTLEPVPFGGEPAAALFETAPEGERDNQRPCRDRFLGYLGP